MRTTRSRYDLYPLLPAGTRTVSVNLTATRYVGTDNDGYFDDLSLTISTDAPGVVVNVTAEGRATRVARRMALRYSKKFREP